MTAESTVAIDSIAKLRLRALDGQRYVGMMALMYAIQQAGFTDEFDNSRVMRMLWTKMGELQQAVGRIDSEICFTTNAVQHPLHGIVLKIVLQSSIVENVNASMDLFIRNDGIAVSSDVLTEEVKPVADRTEVLASGVYWFEAEKQFKACKHFDKVALKAFRALYRALAPRGDGVALRLQITPLQLGWRVEYRLHGTKILVTQFDFNKS